MVIASRILRLRQDQAEALVEVRIFAPQEEEDRSWVCRYEIDWPGERRNMDVFGVDAVQALVLALQTIGAEIYTSDYHKSGKLFVEALGHGYGFPVMPALRDLLQGDDARYL
jgi:hypothetical protein